LEAHRGLLLYSRYAYSIRYGLYTDYYDGPISLRCRTDSWTTLDHYNVLEYTIYSTDLLPNSLLDPTVTQQRDSIHHLLVLPLVFRVFSVLTFLTSSLSSSFSSRSTDLRLRGFRLLAGGKYVCSSRMLHAALPCQSELGERRITRIC
jgi:hypothetical protein